MCWEFHHMTNSCSCVLKTPIYSSMYMTYTKNDWYHVIKQLLTFVLVKIRIYQSKEYDIYLGSGLGKCHILWIDKSLYKPQQKSIIIYYYMTSDNVFFWLAYVPSNDLKHIIISSLFCLHCWNVIITWCDVTPGEYYIPTR